MDNSKKSIVRQPFLRRKSFLKQTQKQTPKNAINIHPIKEVAENIFNYYWNQYLEENSNLSQYEWTVSRSLIELSECGIFEQEILPYTADQLNEGKKITDPAYVGAHSSMRSLTALAKRKDPVGDAANLELGKRRAADPGVSQEAAAKHFLDVVVPHYAAHNPKVLEKLGGVKYGTGIFGKSISKGIKTALKSKEPLGVSAPTQTGKFTSVKDSMLRQAQEKKAADEQHAKNVSDAIEAHRNTPNYLDIPHHQRKLVSDLYQQKRPELEKQMKSIAWSKDSPGRNKKIADFIETNKHFMHHIGKETVTSLNTADASDKDVTAKIMKDHPHITKPYQAKDFVGFVRKSPIHDLAYKGMSKKFPTPIKKEEPKKTLVQKVKGSLGLQFAKNATSSIHSLFKKVTK